MASFKLWIGASAADTITRLAVQLGSTMVVARLLTAEEFGLASLVLGVTTIMSAFIGLPFEESLAQRRKLYTAHLETALFVSAVLTVICVLASAAFGPLVEHFAQAPGFAIALTIASLMLFAQGPGSVARAIARRHRRFVDLSTCNALSTVLACGVSVLAAFAGWGVYSLILQRLLPNVFYPVLALGVLKWRGHQIWVPMRWHGPRFRELFRFSWLHLADVMVTNAGPAALAFLINGFFGQAVLGMLNIALRIVDPLRSALLSVGHNLVFSVLVRMQHDSRQLTTRAAEIASGIAFVIVPAFVGLAVSAPVLLPMLVGPGWESAIPLSQLLCFAVAFSLPFNFYFSGYSALGRPEYGLAGSLLSLVAMVAVFLVAAWLGLGNVAGIAFVSYEVAKVVAALFFAIPISRRALLPALDQLVRIWIGALVMAIAVEWWFFGATPAEVTVENLLLIVLMGVVVYPAAMLLICPRCLRQFLHLLRNK